MNQTPKTPTIRTYDIVVYGATGFTGRLVADHMVRTMPPGSSWAIAGRNEAKLQAEMQRLKQLPGADVQPAAYLVADSADGAALTTIAQQSAVVITTVGPYLMLGEPLVKACAESGTHYVDLTGENEFVDNCYLKYDAIAKETGAKIVHTCGFDSIPFDIGVYYTIEKLRELGIRDTATVDITGMVIARGQFSGGTFHSAIGQISRAKQLTKIAAQRAAVEEKNPARTQKIRGGTPHFDKRFNRWLIPMPTIDPIVVTRSAAALEQYGPNFTYSHCAGVKKLPMMVGSVAGIAAIALAVQAAPLRSLILKYIDRGEGPSDTVRAKSSFDVTFKAIADGRTMTTQVRGDDPGYTETSMMLAESAKSLAFDANPSVAGQLTTAAAMGSNLLRRLQEQGLEFEVLDNT